MAQSKKLFFALLLALFLHLAILQVRFSAGTSELSPYNTTEIGLVQLSAPQKTVSTTSAETSHQKLHDTNGVVNSSTPHIVKIENLKSPETKKKVVQQSTVALVEDDTGEVSVSKVMPERKQRSAEKVVVTTSVSDDETVALADQVAGESVHRTETAVEKIDVMLKNIEKSVHKPTEEMPVVTTPANGKAETLTKISGAIDDSSAPSGRNGAIKVQKAIPRYDVNPRPVYPDIALRKGWEGLVLLRVDVKQNGFVERVEIEESSGFNALDRAALKAVRRWQFTPAMSAGLPVDDAVVVPISFVF